MDQILDRFRSSTFGWLRGTMPGWGTIVLALAGAVAVVLAGGEVLPISPYIGLALIAIALLILLWKWVENLAITYEITEERLILRRGIFVKSIDDIELYRVKDVRLDFTLWGQWAGIGTIRVNSSDEITSGGALVMPDIAGAQPRREVLRRLVDTARQKRRVRELDVAGEDFA